MPLPYSGDLILFQAMDANDPIRLEFPDMGWSSLIEGNFEMLPVSGNHRTMINNPHVKELAVIWGEYMREIDRILSIINPAIK